VFKFSLASKGRSDSGLLPRDWQAIRLYGLLVVASANCGFITYISAAIAPKCIANIVAGDSWAVVIQLGWVIPSLVLLAATQAVCQYFGESLALDWRRDLTRMVISRHHGTKAVGPHWHSRLSTNTKGKHVP
jgi:hypothetical protein